MSTPAIDYSLKSSILATIQSPISYIFQNFGFKFYSGIFKLNQFLLRESPPAAGENF